MNSELLLSLPPNMCGSLPVCDPELAARCFATFDPPGSQLGSGGGTAYLLEQGWGASRDGNRDFQCLEGEKGESSAFFQWLERGNKLLVHSGGESRRLPAYAAAGKSFMPVPALRWKYGQRLDQTLLDMQKPFLDRVMAAASGARTMVASGDVLLEGSVDSLPDADVVLLGMWTTPEDAEHFGVFFCDQKNPEHLVKFLQKPAPEVTRELSRSRLFMVDVGVWLLSERAVACLMKKCGWDADAQSFSGGLPGTYDLYGEWALHLGSDPEEPDADVSELSVAVMAVENGEFYHFGRSSDIIDSSYRLQNKVMDQTQLGAVPSMGQPKQFILNSVFDARRSEDNTALWIENSFVPKSWGVTRRNVITNIPENDWTLELADGRCLDIAPVGDDAFAIRGYGFDDAFRGPVGDPSTAWMGSSVISWLEKRNLSLEEAGLDPQLDLQLAPLFPMFGQKELDGAFIQWMLDENPAASSGFSNHWKNSTRLSAREIGQQANLKRLMDQRRDFCSRSLPVMIRHGANSLFYKLDISRAAQEYARAGLPLIPEEEIAWRGDRMLPVHDQIFRSAVCRERGEEALAKQHKQEAFDRLHTLLVGPLKSKKPDPFCPVPKARFVGGPGRVGPDRAGGGREPPLFCLKRGGSFFSVFLNTNGQPPIQVFVRHINEPELVIRSIDLGLKETLKTYEDVGAYNQLGSGFAIARAAFALTGFHPDFNGSFQGLENVDAVFAGVTARAPRFQCLEKQLEAFGGGIEVSLLAALPKGSGLGTSSILAGTLLGGLADFCGLGWDCIEIARRVSALEQMLGSGGGWQDQYGGILPGAKLIETKPGLSQDAVVRRASSEFFDEAIRDGRILLYYTGVTRVAHDVLGEIVCNMFLNESEVLTALEGIAENGAHALDVVQRGEWDEFVQVIRKSWELNRKLDSGVNPPAVQEIIQRIEGSYAALKLAGAGGGGYMILITESHEQSMEIKRKLTGSPPNKNARFVDLEVSKTGLQISRS
ncbi:MAG: bifunctional fucokinase/L-fucose-1-P-guanylyltransferase [Kiritimatiellaeota bacterium]|nr:bifunctional fucokinase/L-fucose-1-P-guanylyltransferase [Kiritimatiellota bacterium]